MKPNQANLGFVLTFISIVGLFLLAFFKNVDINATLPVILATYVGARASEKIVSINAACKDANCDTRQVIHDLEHGTGPQVDKPD